MPSKQNIFAVLGSDEAEVKRAAAEQAAQLSPKEGGEFGTDIIDGAVDSVDQAVKRIQQTVEALLTLPFLGGEKLVWLKSANFLGDNVMGQSESVLDALESLLQVLQSGLPDDVRFLLSATELDKRRSFYKNLSKLAKVVVFDKLDSSRGGWEGKAVDHIEPKARSKGLRFQPDALELFALLTGGESRQVENELEKLDLFLGPKSREVTAEVVQKMVPLSRAGVIFEIGNAIAERDLEKCLRLTEQMLFRGESPIGILLVAVIPTIRNLLLVKDLMKRHNLRPPDQPFYFGSTLKRLPAEAVEHLPRKKDGTINDYSLGIAAGHAHRYKMTELVGLMEAALEANIQLVSSQLEAKMVFTTLFARLAQKSAA